MRISGTSYHRLSPRLLLAPFWLAAILLLPALFTLAALGRNYEMLGYEAGSYASFSHIPGRGGAMANTLPSQGHSPWLGSLHERQELAWPLIRRFSEQENLDPALVMALVQVESRFDPMVTSKRGAAGLMQINKVTARHLGLDDPFNPEANLAAGIRYLGSLGKMFNNNTRLMLAAYNAGPGRVQAAGREVPDIKETQEFVDKVLNHSGYFRDRFQ
ncbi:MAG: lytic transglycosylase domain-containing protein [Desulfarculales bacterium]|jgi:soluble lytic murein transglycosylase-like protein|nr:lytic transglycosylase domain-containing protein [Desulfarculales bacterium]